MKQFNFFPEGIEIEILQFIFAKSRDSAVALWKILEGKLKLNQLLPSTNTLIPLVYWQIERLGIRTKLLHPLRHIYLKTWQANEIIISRFKPVKSAFQQLDIPFIPLKGYALAGDYYPDGALRPMGDIDILVKPADYKKAAFLLEKLGYRLSADLPDIAKQGMHALNYITNDGCESIDLHSQVVHGGNRSHVTDYVWEHAFTELANGKNEYQLAPSDLLFNILAHGMVPSTVFAVRWIPDALFIIRKDPSKIDWDRICLLAEVSRRGFLFSHQLHFLNHEFGLSISKSILTDLNDQEIGHMERVSYSFITQRTQSAFVRRFQLYYRSIFFGISNLQQRDVISIARYVGWFILATLRRKVQQIL